MQQPERIVGVVVATAALLLVGWQGEAGRSPASIHSASYELVAKPPPGRGPEPGRSPRRASLGAGKLLIATPQLNGPFFGQSVVLLLDYDANGAIGLIINQKRSLKLAEILPDVSGVDERADRVYLGGPVSPSRIGFLIRGESKVPDSRHLVDEVRFSGSLRALEHVIESGTPASRFHVYLGYAGWGAGQLDGEFERGDWWVAPADAELIFDENPDNLWRRLLFRFGGVHVWHRELHTSSVSG